MLQYPAAGIRLLLLLASGLSRPDVPSAPGPMWSEEVSADGHATLITDRKAEAEAESRLERRVAAVTAELAELDAEATEVFGEGGQLASPPLGSRPGDSEGHRASEADVDLAEASPDLAAMQQGLAAPGPGQAAHEEPAGLVETEQGDGPGSPAKVFAHAGARCEDECMRYFEAFLESKKFTKRAQGFFTRTYDTQKKSEIEKAKPRTRTSTEEVHSFASELTKLIKGKTVERMGEEGSGDGNDSVWETMRKRLAHRSDVFQAAKEEALAAADIVGKFFGSQVGSSIVVGHQVSEANQSLLLDVVGARMDVAKRRSGTYVDLGCGNGNGAKALTQVLDFGHGYGLEVGSAYAGYAEADAHFHGVCFYDGVHVGQAVAAKNKELGIAGGKNPGIDFITINHVLHHVEPFGGDLNLLIGDMLASMSPGGLVVLKEHDYQGVQHGVFLDIIHALFEILNSFEHGSGETSMPKTDFRNEAAWKAAFEANGFEFIKTDRSRGEYGVQNPLYVMSLLFTKPATPAAGATRTGGKRGPHDVVAAGTDAFKAGACAVALAVLAV